MKKNKESLLMGQVLEAANNFGYFRRNNTGVARYKNKNGTERFVKFGKKGSADIEGIIHGYHVSIETKSKGEQQTKEQIEHELRVVCAGGYYLLVDDLDVCIHDLEKITKEVRNETTYRPINSEQRVDARAKLYASKG